MAGVENKIIDNFIDPLLCKTIYTNILRLPKTEQVSYIGASKGSKFFMSDISQYDNIILYLLEKAKECFNQDLEYLRSYANIQFKGQDGDWHFDDGDYTILLMVSETLKDGKLEINQHKVDFIQNRCVIFDTKQEHRALASKYATLPRCTVAIKTKIKNGNN
jgi:hypothetical protein